MKKDMETFLIWKTKEEVERDGDVNLRTKG